MLAERAAVTQLQVKYYDGLVAQAEGAREARLKMLLKLQDAAHRRHLAALKTYAVVKRLLKPSPSPIEVATRLDRGSPPTRLRRDGVAGAVGVRN